MCICRKDIAILAPEGFVQVWEENLWLPYGNKQTFKENVI